MLNETDHNLDTLLANLPGKRYLMTAAHDGKRSGAVFRWLQRCSDDPEMVMLSMRKGSSIVSIIRDSGQFGILMLHENISETTLRRFRLINHFDVDDAVDQESRLHSTDLADRDPFLGLNTTNSPHGHPVLPGNSAFLDCELVRHVDIECDHELFIGRVLAGGDVHS